jgi:hypothetical protein
MSAVVAEHELVDWSNTRLGSGFRVAKCRADVGLNQSPIVDVDVAAAFRDMLASEACPNDQRGAEGAPRTGWTPRGPGNERLRPVRCGLGLARPSVSSSGGGGNRTRVRGRTGQNLYKRSPPLNLARRPEADALPAGQPSFAVALWAIGSPSAPSPFVGAATRATGPTRSDVAT